MLTGIGLFSGSLCALSLTGLRWLGAITPVGGVSFLVAMVNGLVAELLIAAHEKKILSAIQFIKTAVVSLAVITAVFYGRWRIGQEAECIRPGPKAE